ncbi:MAG TPA: winged helix-turn-helix transcriptional regulator [Candidatus Limnocylindria bacterium]|nr:winged helix-turn-helix transcriptional regulator [Candidatus Limnocylindria bacterium]
MARQHERNLAILTAIGEKESLTQRLLAERLGVALGLTNLYLKRLVTKGYVKVADFPAKPAARKRLRYLLTAKGLSEKTRLTYEYMHRSLDLYRVTRETLRDALMHLPRSGVRRVALYGRGEAAELAYLTLRELGLDPVAVFAAEPGGTFLGMPVRDVRELVPGEIDVVVVATFDKPKLHVPALAALGIPADKLLMLQPPARANGVATKVAGHLPP